MYISQYYFVTKRLKSMSVCRRIELETIKRRKNVSFPSQNTQYPIPKITDHSQNHLSNPFINFRTYGNHKISLTQNSAQAILQRCQKQPGWFCPVDRH